MDSDNRIRKDGNNNTRRVQVARAERNTITFEDLTTDQQEAALLELTDTTSQLVGDTIARNLRAARQNRLLNLETHIAAGRFFYKIE
jgi:hypothetical protein